ncbi:hypothetical protein AB0A77_33955 [Streptomyces varsoviensis]|uniref:hypothetical protein n=1 Tax=Streptomyces varsoviensis TaxID=67373 RepID=UPI003407C333
MTVRSAWLLPLGQTREDTRLAPLGTMAPAGALTSRPGVIAGGEPFAATGASAMQVQVGVGRALVQGTAAQGAYPVAVTAPEVLTVADGDAQFGRVDSLVLRVVDPLYDTAEQVAATVEIIQGTPEAAPSPPALPSACLRLWDVAVPAGTSAGVGGITWSSALTDRRRYTAAYGGITPRGGQEPGAFDGQYRDNGAGLDRWSGAAAAWQPLDPVIDWTWVTIAGGYTNNGNAQGTVRYRRIMIAGMPHMQWLGGVAWDGKLPADGYPFAAPLPAECRPINHVSLAAAAGGAVTTVDFQRGGLVRIIDLPGVRTWVSFTGLIYPLGT